MGQHDSSVTQKLNHLKTSYYQIQHSYNLQSELNPDGCWCDYWHNWTSDPNIKTEQDAIDAAKILSTKLPSIKWRAIHRDETILCEFDQNENMDNWKCSRCGAAIRQRPTDTSLAPLVCWKCESRIRKKKIITWTLAMIIMVILLNSTHQVRSISEKFERALIDLVPKDRIGR